MVATPQYKPPAQRVLASAPDAQVPLWGITLEHPAFERTHWLINRPQGKLLTLENGTPQFFEASYFELTLPKMDGQGQQDAAISLQNVDRVIVDELELASTLPSKRIDVTLRLYVESDPGAVPQNVPIRLSIASVQATNAVVTGTAGRPDTLNRAFPLEVYRIDRFPGLDR